MQIQMPDEGTMKVSLGRVDSLSVAVHLELDVAITSPGKCFMQFFPRCECGEAKGQGEVAECRAPASNNSMLVSLPFCACGEANVQCGEAERRTPASNHWNLF